jgi:hypothetical protein
LSIFYRKTTKSKRLEFSDKTTLLYYNRRKNSRK